jgi:TPR repeat protein
MIPNVPAEVSSTIHRALRKDPAKRFASIEGFARALRGEALDPADAKGVRRRTPQPAVPGSRFGWLKPVVSVMVLAAGLYGAGKAGVFKGSGPTPAPPPAVPPATAPVDARSANNPGDSRTRTNPVRRPTDPSLGLTRDSTPAPPPPAAVATTCAQAMVQQDWATAFTRCTAERDSSSAAKRNLGILYAEGKGVAKNDRQATVLLGLAAQDPELPDTQAVILAAQRYDAGLGVPGGPDRSKAAGLWEIAAAMGWSAAWPIIAERYALGDGRRKNEATAAHWYGKAAEIGHTPSMLRLAELLDRGQGIKKDEVAAGRWYTKAADLRDPEGEYQVAMRLLNGKGGFAKDEAQGMQWLRRAAAQGHSEAIKELARRGG